MLKVWLPIESGIPIPPAATSGRKYGSKGAVQWRKMKVGDSVLFTNAHPDHVASLASSTGARYGWRFTCRIIDSGVRVWRVA